jgi:16S rRNA (uracil1498-N3)-methyltransferase
LHLFYQPNAPAATYLTDDDSRHAIRTLRLTVGSEIAITDGRGTRFSAIITQADAKRCEFRIKAQDFTPARSSAIRICVAPTKNLDRIEWFVEKAVEIGVERISFFFGQHSERRVLKLDRIEKIAVSAMKQSLQSWLPQLDEAVPFAQLLPTITDSARFIAHLPDGQTPPSLFSITPVGQSITVLIGPEGDFSPNELQQAQSAGFQIVVLGKNRLRTETAALVALMGNRVTE